MSFPASAIQPLLLDFVAHFARTTPDKVAVHDLAADRRLTYAQLDDAIDRAATVLTGLLGTPQGARVAVLSRNSADMLVLHFACVRSGAIFVPLNWRLAAAEITFMLRDCEPSLIVLEPRFAELVEDRTIPRLVFDDSASGFAARLAAAPPPARPRQGAAVAADTPITLLYSSGTTGKPKGVIVTQMNAFAGALNLALGTKCSPDCVFLCDMPMFHTAGLFAAARVPLLMGGRVLISQKFEAQVTYERLADPALGITHYFSVTQMAMMMRQLPNFDGRRLARLTAYITGGAPNPEAHILRWLDDGVMMVNGWGMSEICSAVAQPVGDIDRIRAHPSAVGLPHLTVEMKLVDANGREVGVGEPGEIWVRGANVTPGYWRRPELNETAFRDGWFRTGDVAVRDADGFYSIIDRIKDMFISGGENVYPAEIEAVIVELPQVGDVAVVGIPDAQWGEVGCAFVVVAPGATLDVPTLEQHCRSRLAKFKVPKRFEIVDSLPRTPSGKVQKHLLRPK
ncbi:MAG: AMP-binding protein [Steroidobacteraceae bacterium]|nr:AMP-binding protein [Steroidobacteraceae bacterium]